MRYLGANVKASKLSPPHDETETPEKAPFCHPEPWTVRRRQIPVQARFPEGKPSAQRLNYSPDLSIEMFHRT